MRRTGTVHAAAIEPRRAGDTVSVKGFAVNGMEGALLVATEVHKGDKTVSRRDESGQPAW